MKNKENIWSTIVFSSLLVYSCAKHVTPEQTGAAETKQEMQAQVAGNISETNLNHSNSSSDSHRVELPTVHFDFNQAVLHKEDLPKLKLSADQLARHKRVDITIQGNCDERGSDEYNLALGAQRASAVKSYLEKLGINGSRISTISYGKERPLDLGHDEAAWAKNRRADLVSSNSAQAAGASEPRT